jgi:4-hydroxybenzoate polyprenyltransferase
MVKYILLLRPKQWIKNVLICLGPLGAGLLTTTDSYYKAFFGVVVFTLASGFVYIVNDTFDVKRDQSHPTKVNRPIASGAVTIRKGLIFGGFLLFILFLLLRTLTSNQFLWIMFYLLTNFIYSLGLKKVPIIEMFVVSMGYIIRVLFGASLFDIKASNWLLLCILTGSFGLIAAKRYSELLRVETYSLEIKREVLGNYSLGGLQSIYKFSWYSTFATYSIWTLEKNVYSINALGACTSVFLILVLLLQAIEKGELEQPEDLILRPTVWILGMCWVTFLIGLVA